MYIDYSDIYASLGGYERVVYALSGDCPTAVVHSSLYISKEGIFLEFLNKNQKSMYQKCSINKKSPMYIGKTKGMYTPHSLNE